MTRFRTATASRRTMQCGLTMIELVVVMMIMGIVAAFAAPRLTQSDSEERALAEQLRSILRNAQRIAATRNRDVCVLVTANTVVFRSASSSGAAVACTNPLTLLSSAGDTLDIAIPAGSPLTFVSAGGNFRFTPSGTLTSIAGAALTAAPTISIRRSGVTFATMNIQTANGFVLASTF